MRAKRVEIFSIWGGLGIFLMGGTGLHVAASALTAAKISISSCPSEFKLVFSDMIF